MALESVANKTALPPAIPVVAAAIFVIGGFGPNNLLAALAIAVLLVGTFLLWRPGESPILLFVFGYQWLQASIIIFNANWLDKEVAALSPYGSYGGDVRLAILLSLLGIVALGVGMRVGAGPWRPEIVLAIRSTALAHSSKAWFKLYFAAFVLAFAAQSFAWVVPGLSQPLLALASLKWAAYWMLAYATFAQAKTDRVYLFVALATELAFGISGYFSDFKTVLFFTFLALVPAGVRMSAGRAIGLSALIGVTISAGIIWTAVKVDYRTFVSGGEKSQIVTVDYAARMNVLIGLVEGIDRAKLADATQALLSRLSYVDFFSMVLETVPSQLPHEGGALWLDAITRPFMPRLFFLSKAVIDDSERTNYYTGVHVAGADEGTSISLGYVAESYIDFGSIFMMVPIFALGLVLGGFYRKMIVLDQKRVLLGMSLATATIYGATFLESSITKVVGGLVIAALVAWALVRFLKYRNFPWPLYTLRRQR